MYTCMMVDVNRRGFGRYRGSALVQIRRLYFVLVVTTMYS